MTDSLCAICNMNPPAQKSEYCPACQRAIDNQESWALKMLDIQRQVKNAGRRAVKEYDPSRDELLKTRRDSMNEVLADLQGALGIEDEPPTYGNINWKDDDETQDGDQDE